MALAHAIISERISLCLMEQSREELLVLLPPR